MWQQVGCWHDAGSKAGWGGDADPDPDPDPPGHGRQLCRSLADLGVALRQDAVGQRQLAPGRPCHDQQRSFRAVAPSPE